MMKNRSTLGTPARHALACAVQAAVASLAMAAAARAADPALAEVAYPANSLEVGALVPNKASAKADEYNGQNGKGPFSILGFDVRGGGTYDSEDATRWRLFGSDLGLQARRLGAEVGEQGRFRLTLGYDEFLRNRSDTYQTPLLGVGTDSLTLPGSWLAPLVPRVNSTAPGPGASGGANARGLLSDVTNSSALVAGVLTPPTAAQLAQAASIQAADLPLFQKVSLSTQRSAYSVGLTAQIDAHWQVAASVRREDKTGLKPMSTVTRYTNGDLATVIPDLIDTQTSQYNASLSWVGDKGVLTAAYYGSVFTNNVPSMSWANWAYPGNVQTMSSAPSNQYHQVSLNGNYAFSRETHAAAQFSFGRSTQNDPFLTDSTTLLVPAANLNGLVLTKAASLKLVSHATHDLTLSAGWKLDDRLNRTPVNIYGFTDAGELPSGTSLFAAYFPGATLSGNTNLNANRAYSKRLNQFNLQGSYAFTPGQSFDLSAEHQQVDHSCPGSWIACADASSSSENTLRGEWRLRAFDAVEAHLGLSGARRKVDYTEDAWLALVPMANLSPTGAPGGATAYGTMLALGLTGYGPISGLNPLPTPGTAAAFFFANNNALGNALYGNQNRISELPGMRRYNMADRDRRQLRTSVNWQASEAFSLQAGLDLNDDQYNHSVYGLQSARSHALNIDGTWSPSATYTLTIFLTAEDQRSTSAGNSYTANSTATSVNGFTAIEGGCFATISDRNQNNKIDPCLDWAEKARDKVNTVGVNAQKKSLLGGKLDISGGITYAQARSDINVTGGNYANNPLAVTGAAPGTTAAFYLPAAPLPTVRTTTTDVRLTARYAVAKDQRLGVGLLWQHMTSTDWAYDGRQLGGLSGVLPTLETAPSYNIATFSVSYSWLFR